MNKTKYKSLDKIAGYSFVEEIWDEGRDGIWISLAPGYNWNGASVVHEWTVRDLIKSFSQVTKGDTY